MSVKLKRLSVVAAKEGRYTVVLPGHLNNELTDYLNAYKEAYPDDQATPDQIIPAIISQFLASDSGFQTWKKERDGNSGSTRKRKPTTTSGNPPAGGTAA